MKRMIVRCATAAVCALFIAAVPAISGAAIKGAQGQNLSDAARLSYRSNIQPQLTSPIPVPPHKP